MLQIRYTFTTELALNAAYPTQVSQPPSPGQVMRFIHNTLTYTGTILIQNLSQFFRLLPVLFSMPLSNLPILLLPGRFLSLVMSVQSFLLESNQIQITCIGQ